MFIFNPYLRISLDEILEHPYLSDVRTEDDQTMHEGDLDFSFEQKKLEMGEIRGMFVTLLDEFNESRQ